MFSMFSILIHVPDNYVRNKRLKLVNVYLWMLAKVKRRNESGWLLMWSCACWQTQWSVSVSWLKFSFLYRSPWQVIDLPNVRNVKSCILVQCSYSSSSSVPVLRDVFYLPAFFPAFYCNSYGVWICNCVFFFQHHKETNAYQYIS